MTRAELVKKLTSYAVVDEGYAALFMETFLMLLHKRLHKYDTFILPFEISFSQQKIIRNNEEFFLITCSSTGKIAIPGEDLVFAVPSVDNEFHPDKYAVFSIGIAKQIIPTKEMVASGFTFEPSFSLKKYFRGKAENLLQSGEFISKKTEPSEFAWDFTSPDHKNRFSTDESLREEISKEVQEFSWDFGNNWKRELQEEEILSVDESVDGIFGSKSPREEEDVKEVVAEDVGGGNFEEVESEKVFASEDEKISQTRIEEVDFSKLHEKLEKKESGSEYQEVRAKTQEMSIDLSEFEKSFDSDLNGEEPEGSSQEEESEELSVNQLDDEFVHVQSTSEVVLAQEQEGLLTATDPFKSYTIEKTELESKKSSRYSTEKENITNIPIEKTLVEEDDFPEEEESLDKDNKQVKRGKGTLFWTAISAVLIIVIFIFLYWKMWGIPPWLNMPNQTAQVGKSKPAVIERGYDIPVTYPYEVKITEVPKPEQGVDIKTQTPLATKTEVPSDKTPVIKNDLEAADIFSKNNPFNQTGKSVKQTHEQVASSKPKIAEIKEPTKKKEVVKEKIPAAQKTVLIKDNIYQEGSTYVVQLSSWKSESIANQEVARLQRKGIKAFKSSVVIPQKGGTWYRVKVGGFSSAEDASRFYNSIK